MSRIRTIHDSAKLKMMYGLLMLAFAIFMTFNSWGVAYSQQDQGQQTFFESAVNAANQSAASSMAGGQVQGPSGAQQEAQGGPLAERTTLASGIEPELDENFIWSGLISSNIDELPTAEGDPQSAVILPLRDDSALYVGGLTYQSNSPVEVVVWNVANLNNSTSVPEEFGEIDGIGMVEGRAVIPTEIASGTSGSVPFIGNVLELVGDEDEPFIATYAIDAIAGEPTVIGNSTFSDPGINESE